MAFQMFAKSISGALVFMNVEKRFVTKNCHLVSCILVDNKIFEKLENNMLVH